MKKIVTLILFFLLIKVFAGELPRHPVFVGPSDPKNITIPDSCYNFLEMGDKKFTLKQVIARGTKPLPDITEKINISFFSNHVNSWVWYRLKNKSKNAFIVALYANSENTHIYVFDKGKLHKYVTGQSVAWSKKDGDKNKNYIPYTLQANSEVVIYSNEEDVHSSPVIGNFIKISKDTYLNDIVFSEEYIVNFGFAGFLLFGMIFNLLFYYVSREKLYLVYSLLLFFSAFSIADEPICSLLFRENTGWVFYFRTFTGTGWIIMFVYTVRYLFSMKKYFPRWDNVLAYYPPVFVSFTLFCELILNVFNYKSDTIFSKSLMGIWAIALLVAVILLLGFIVLLIRMLIILARRKDREARLFTLAVVPFFASFIFSIALSSGWITLCASIWAIVVLSWGMFARFKRLQEEYAMQALDKEKIAREKEEEKNAIIAQQNVLLEKLVTERTADLKASIESLRQTQDQLIQSEKMASLGELTAGIAHEIQNPLNFVNNFSDVSIELLEEMEEELDKGDTEEVKALATDIKQKLEKIAHHGRRADGIVKGMLQHSRASSGQKEPTDINALADEYLRLAYHGLRAKDKSFNADLVTHFAEGLPKVNIIPQDIGRVLLNLFTNAFYATNEKSKQLAVVSGQSSGYKPVVVVSTQLKGNKIEINVKDNGTGIPDEIKDKILQPFFTTKPTGEGTGLGLSLSYDIVVKGHGGTIDINSEEGVFSEFVIKLAVS